MSIQILKGSFNEHRTVENIEVTTKYIMDIGDYYAGLGDLYDGDWKFLYRMHLPWEGDNFGVYYNTCYLSGCVLNDISMEHTHAISHPSSNNTGFDEDKKIIVTYLWNNNGGVDTKRANEASSWKISYNTTLNSMSVDSYHEANIAEGTIGELINWGDQYLTELNPNVKMTKTNAAGEEEEKDYGMYVAQTDSIKQLYKETVADTIPQFELRVPNLTCSVTAYSSSVRGATLATYIGSVNSVDFLESVYTAKELALAVKNKLTTYESNDWFAVNDSRQWMFIDSEATDLGSGLYEYVLTFEHNKKGWNDYMEAGDPDIEIILNRYKEIDFYNVLLAGMDMAIPNSRLC